MLSRDRSESAASGGFIVSSIFPHLPGDDRQCPDYRFFLEAFIQAFTQAIMKELVSGLIFFVNCAFAVCVNHDCCSMENWIPVCHLKKQFSDDNRNDA